MISTEGGEGSVFATRRGASASPTGFGLILQRGRGLPPSLRYGGQESTALRGGCCPVARCRVGYGVSALVAW